MSKIKTSTIQDDSFPAYVFVKLITMATKEQGKRTLFDIKEWKDLPSRKEIDVSLTIQGVEVPFIEAINSLKSEFDRQVEHHARKIVTDKINDQFEVIDERVDEIKRKLKLLIDDLK